MSSVTLRIASLSWRWPTRLVVVNILLAVVLACLAANALLGGTYPITFADLTAALRGDSDAVTRMIVIDHRLTRLLVAIGVGLAFGLAGEIVQTQLRNPLASPDIIGFTAGAGVGAVLAVLISGSTAAILFGALSGGTLAAVLILGLAWNRGIRPGQIVLMGIGITMTLSVVNDLLMTTFTVNDASDIAKWLVGSLDARSWQDVILVWIGLLILAPPCFYAQFSIARLALRDETAQTLGIRVDRTRLWGFALAVLLVALAVGAAGPLPFVAFVAGPIAHGLTRTMRPSLLTAALVGALVTLGADTAANVLPGGLSLPAGIFTALVGAPVLIWTLFLQTRKRLQ
ncbi:iron chelate uptake ABC transporter family permease subunit [Rhodobacteraceae bacterium R_SAG9]|nr:iron chelate uptake ABC transporter family permease subunit [Rhodobacteraceae bacterium R_SAG9]